MRNDFGTRPYKSRFGGKAAMKKGGKVKMKKQGYKARLSVSTIVVDISEYIK